MHPGLVPEEVILGVRTGKLDMPQALAKLRQSSPAKQEGRAIDALMALVGLDQVKELARELEAYVEVRRRRQAAGLKTEPLMLHMAFTGSPGTGKTTVARLFGRIFKELGVLSQGHLIELERADLVGEYIGHTAQRTREQVRRAIGGILFIDEAYSLARGGERDFGKEAVDTLVKAMEDHRDNLAVILAGYREEMSQFLAQNTGLRSRIPIHQEFPDFTGAQLLAVSACLLKEKQYRLDEAAATLLQEALAAELARPQRSRGNGRTVRNLIERAIRRQGLRVVREERTSPAELARLSAQDLREAFPC